MERLYAITLSLAAYSGEPVTLTGYHSTQTGDVTDTDRIEIKLGTPESPEDFRDWLRQALAMAIEEL